MSREIIHLSSPITILEYNPDTGELFFIGDALEEGAWCGMSGKTAFYPREVIHAAAPGFIGVDFCCEHGHRIGRVLDVYLTDLGFKIKGVIWNSDMIAAVLEGRKSGLSIGADIYVDIRRIVQSIVNIREVSLVAQPACRTCYINYPEGETVAMSSPEDKIEPQIKAFEKLQKAAIALKDAQRNLTDTVLNSLGDTADIEVTKMSEGEIKTGEPVETEEVVPADAGESGGEGTGEVKPEVVEMSTFNDVKTQLTDATAKLELATAQLADFESANKKLTEELESIKTELSAKIEAEKTKMIEAILSLDPNADKETLSGMTTEQLSAARSMAERISSASAASLGAKATKQDVQLSAPHQPQNVSKRVLEYLLQQEK
jgi:hypothetical protein